MERMRLTREQWLHELQVRAMEYENICVSCWAQWLETFLSRQAPTVSHVHFYFFYMGLRHAAYYYFHSCKLSFSLLPSSLAAGATLSDSCVSPLIADVILMMNLRCNSWLICTDVSAIRVLDSLMV